MWSWDHSLVQNASKDLSCRVGGELWACRVFVYTFSINTGCYMGEEGSPPSLSRCPSLQLRCVCTATMYRDICHWQTYQPKLGQGASENKWTRKDNTRILLCKLMKVRCCWLNSGSFKTVLSRLKMKKKFQLNYPSIPTTDNVSLGHTCELASRGWSSS